MAANPNINTDLFPVIGSHQTGAPFCLFLPVPRVRSHYRVGWHHQCTPACGFSCLFRLLRSGGGGLRQRLAEPDTVPDEGGGIRRRREGTGMLISHSWEDSEPLSQRRRLVAAEDPDSTLPFNRCMKRDWGSGKLSSVKIQEYARGAAAQGGAWNWPYG